MMGCSLCFTLLTLKNILTCGALEVKQESNMVGVSVQAMEFQRRFEEKSKVCRYEKLKIQLSVQIFGPVEFWFSVMGPLTCKSTNISSF
ncbi:hypothetical protein DKX38_011706 [Salix brachista]|uniref:Secreted protein n=1 Tax=Salix brachista TaxID=2182728 RepID=A0A5N5LZQ6_9ROSI|nr:hypothetical protein DKX38_011706 [Salix brachista]